MKYLIDTHALLWGAKYPGKLGAKARRIIEETPWEVAVCDISFQEVGLLWHLDKIDLGADAERALGALLSEIKTIPITLAAAVKAPALRLHGDQFDRMIVATALTHGLKLITKDGNITDSGLVDVVWS